jgi:hypothetical protein
MHNLTMRGPGTLTEMATMDCVHENLEDDRMSHPMMNHA